MADLLTPTINVIRTCTQKYTDFCVFEEECATFRRSLCNVMDVLNGFLEEFYEGKATGNTRLRRPLELLLSATKEGEQVLEKCASKRKLLAFVFSRQLLGMLGKAKGDVEEAMRLLLLSSVQIQVSTRRVMDAVNESMVELHHLINDSCASKHAVADLIQRELELHRHNQAATLAQATSEVLVKMGVVSCAKEFDDQLVDLKLEADRLRHSKVVYDQEILEAVLALSLETEEGKGHACETPRPAVLNPDALQPSGEGNSLVCPISLEIMHDPVVVTESGITYDREYLCNSLLAHPDLEPATLQHYDRPIDYCPNIAVRNMVTNLYGDSYFQKYNDDEFKVQYERKWNEHQSRCISVDNTQSNNSLARPDNWANPTKHEAPPSKVAASSDHNKSTSFVRPDNRSIEPNPYDAAHPLPCWRVRRYQVLFVVLVLLTVIVIVIALVVTSKSVPSVAKSSANTTSTRIIEKFRKSLPTYTTESLQDETSPQYRSFVWETRYDQVPFRDEANDEELQLFRMTQRFALVTVLESFQLDSFQVAGRINATISECSWSELEIACDSASSVTSLDLSSKAALGHIPREIGLLSKLTSLNLWSNLLNSTIPTELGQLTELVYLDLGSNDLSSTIPTELGYLSALTELILYSNDLTSTIPTELGRLTSLTALSVYNTDLTGTVPSEICLGPSQTVVTVSCSSKLTGQCTQCF